MYNTLYTPIYSIINVYIQDEQTTIEPAIWVGTLYIIGIHKLKIIVIDHDCAVCLLFDL